MTDKGILRILDCMQHNLISTLPELLLNYGSVLFFLAGFYFLYRKRTCRDPRFISLMIPGFLLVMYYLFAVNPIAKIHDYYLFPFYTVLFILVAYGAKQLLLSRLKWLRYLTVLMLLILPLTCYARMQGRWDTESPGFNPDLLNYSSVLREAVPSDALVLAGNDVSGFIMLYYIDKKGWVFREDILEQAQLRQIISRGAGYLCSDSRAVEMDDEVKPYLGELLLQKGSIKVFRLKYPESFEVGITVDAAMKTGELKRIWRFFGADEPNYAYMDNGRKLLGDLGAMRPGEVFFRAHNLLNTGKGTYALKWGSTNAYTLDGEGNPVYDWKILDSIFDAYLENNVRPYVEIGFMPEALSVKPDPYRHYWNPDLSYDEIFTGWAYPPNDYGKWEELVYRWTLHCIERYGREEVEKWYWECWNEPNIPYWQGSPEEFQELHDHAVQGVLRALPTARVGGPDVAGHGGDFSRKFIEHCLRGTNYATGEKGTPLHFFSFHAKGSPDFDSGYVRMNIGRQLSTIERGFRIVASYPELEGIPVIIGESDPEGCAACQGEQLGYRNGTMYSSYTAAIFPRKMDLADRYGVNLEGALTWAFEFEEQPFFAGFRSLSTNGINKPVLNVFRMFSMMEGTRIGVESDAAVPLDDILEKSIRDRPEVNALASIEGNRLYILAWHYQDQDLPGPDAELHLELNNLPLAAGVAEVRTYLVDRQHSNAYTRWLGMGSPQDPDPEQYLELERSSELYREPGTGKLRIEGNHAGLYYRLQRQGVALFVLDLDPGK